MTIAVDMGRKATKTNKIKALGLMDADKKSFSCFPYISLC